MTWFGEEVTVRRYVSYTCNPTCFCAEYIGKETSLRIRARYLRFGNNTEDEKLDRHILTLSSITHL